ncbi:serine carboxypeptidase-like 35 [Humulus lupulus]|uniref:serine carboxypeptidase-like 35 n=1 Tax=Humulus lupulus TaxID=3486 RepID=UPI002B409C79|nr:serine carboxypeptidase-like 35 [Humulus lupulus]
MAVVWKTVVWYFLLWCVVVCTAAAERSKFGGEEAAAEADRVKDLPGEPRGVTFPHYAGYVKLSPHNNHKALFYWFFHAQRNSHKKPLVLWLNGGPGCSSIAYGAAQELGPFLVRANGSLILNKYSWNKAANLLFLEAPVGVGFSYTNRSKDLNELGDRVTAEDSYAFLSGWFKRFPAFKSHDFYIAGESYAGHYVPQLADLIYKRNKGARKENSFINLKGFMIGNAVINDETDVNGIFDYAWSHAIISDQLHQSIMKECNSKKEDNQTVAKCAIHIRDFLEAYADIDIYSIYTPICISSDDNRPSPKPKLHVAPRLFTQHELWHRVPAGYDPCTGDYAVKYFNREDVQRALHANVTKLSYPYSSCSSVIGRWNDSPDTVLPVIRRLLNAGLRIWIYSGDTDGRVPVTSTRYSIKKMGLKVKEEWRAWFEKDQVGGWVEVYEGGLTLATVRGAGHQVPVLAPPQSLSLFTHFLSHNTSLPPSRFSN